VSSTGVTERPRLKPATYIREFIRKVRSQDQEPAHAESDVPPFAPTSAFVLGDEVIECEESV